MAENQELAPTKTTLPKLDDIYAQKEVLSKYNELNKILNAPPKKEWLKAHPIVKVKNAQGQTVPHQYIPIEIVEYLLTSIFVKWRVEIKETKLIANSVVVSIRLHFLDPVSGMWDWQDGVGAAPLQTDQGKGATEFNFIKSAAVQMAAPAAESYAVSDAADKIGTIFGKDVNRQSAMNYKTLDNKFLNQ